MTRAPRRWQPARAQALVSFDAAWPGRLGPPRAVACFGLGELVATPAESIAGGLAYVTEDRKSRGIFAMLGVDDNITVTHLATFARRPWR